MEGGHTAELVEEGGKFIIKFDDGSTETFMTRKAADSFLKSHSELYIGNKKTGNGALDYKIVGPKSHPAKYKVGEEVKTNKGKGKILKVQPMMLSPTPTYLIELDNGSKEWRYEEEIGNKKVGNEQKEFKSVEELDRWCKQNGYMYEERSKGYYSLTNGKDFTTAHVGNAYTPNPELIKILEALLHNRIPEQEAREKIMKITGDKNITDMMIHSPGGFIPVGNKGQWDSKKMVYAKWDEEKGRPSEEFAKITWLGDGKGGLVNVWKGSQMTSEKFGSNDLEELDKNYGILVNNLKRARNSIKTKNGMGVSDLEAQIRKNKEFIRQQKMRMNGKSKPEQDDIAEGIREAEEEIDRMEMRIADLKETGNKKVKNKKFRIVQETPFGNVSLGEWEANSAQEAVKEFIDMNPAFANGKKGHIAAYDK